MIVAEFESVALEHIPKKALDSTFRDEESDGFEDTAVDAQEHACLLYLCVSENLYPCSLEFDNLQSCRERDLLVHLRLV